MMCPHCNKEIIPDIKDMNQEELCYHIRRELDIKPRPSSQTLNKSEVREVLQAIYKFKREQNTEAKP